jgi:murein L,D-transpeptidase YcbB/YkuD
LFRAEIVGVTANPPWNVPASIARNEILPRLKKDARYLADRNMVLVNGPAGDPQGLTVDWGGISGGNFPYQIRQLPGPGNALGKIKLELPNRFSVFLHDTSSRSLFSQTDRYLSHGCVRVQAIKELASYALSQNSGYKPVSLDEAIDSESTMLFRLERILPVYVLYWTAIANFDGSFGFRRDVYNRDDQLIQALDTPTVRHATVQEDLGCPMTG